MGRFFAALGAVIAGAMLATVGRAAPVTATVLVRDAQVHAGPGRQYAVTHRLDAGEQVEVYRQEPGGWLAIRPPEGSFSWVESRMLRRSRFGREGENILEAAADDVPVYVGSTFESRRSTSWVKLRRHERIEALATQDVGGRSWTKIAPPSGEFRWIEAALLEPPKAARRDESVVRRSNSPPPASGSTTNSPPPGERSLAGAPPERSASPPVDGQGADPSVAFGPIDNPRDARRGGANGVGAKGGGANRGVAKSRDRTNADAAAPGKLATPAEIEQRLSQELIGEMDQWRLAPLRDATENLLVEGATPEERKQAQTLLAKIRRFEELRERRLNAAPILASRTPRTVATPAARTPADASNATPPAANVAATESKPAATAGPQPGFDDPKYDAVGRLREVRSQGFTPSPFALVDPSDRFLAFVSPAPGVNLRSYLGQPVGIQGSRAIQPGSTQPHITALRVTSLDGATRR